MSEITTTTTTTYLARTRWTMTVAAATLLAAVIAGVTGAARAVHASPPATTAPVASGRSAVEATPSRDPSVPSAQTVFGGQMKVAPDEIPPTF